MNTSKVFWKIGWRYLMRHPWQSTLMILGIALGVAVVIAIDLANTSANRSFDLSTESVAGKTTHQISAGPEGLNEAIYTQLRQAWILDLSAPVVTAYVSSDRLGNQPLQLLGIDPFADFPFREYLGNVNAKTDTANLIPGIGDLRTFLTQPGSVLISDDLAKEYGFPPNCPLITAPSSTVFSPSPECRLSLDIGGVKKPVFIAGLLTLAGQQSDQLSRRALNGLVLTDISTAQEITGKIGKLDRIDLILPENPQIKAGIISRIEKLLPPGVYIQPVDARTGTVSEMTSAFRVNLSAFSLLALVVGMFLIYNTMTFSVLQRRPFFGTLRCLGATREEIFALVMVEALIMGLIGAALGTGLGILLGLGAVRAVTQTINDLFFVMTVRGIQIPLSSLVKGGFLGVTATLLTAAPPAREAANVAPRAALSRSGLESKALKAVKVAAISGLILLIIGLSTLALPINDLRVSFASTFSVIIGFALLTPMVSQVLLRLMIPFLGQFRKPLVRMAPRNVVTSLSRTSIAIMALMVAVSAIIGVSVMVNSFRHTVITWLGETLQGDIYISAPTLTATTPSAEIDPQVLDRLKSWAGISRVDVLRSVEVESPIGPVHLAATNNTSVGAERIFLSQDVPEETIWNKMLAGGVLVSEPFANRNRLPKHGGRITLYTDMGEKELPILGIYYDYASTQGTVLMALPVYQSLWNDSSITAIALRLNSGTDVDRLVKELQAGLSKNQSLLIRPNRVLRAEVLEVFDRTFAITGALQLLAMMVAFIGILSALLSLELERQHELGILRAVGLTVGQMWRLILIETGLLGALAGMMAIPTGYCLALILVYIINKRSFGWTLQMQLQPQPFIQALFVSILAALLAGLYPAWRIGRTVTAESLRSE